MAVPKIKTEKLSGSQQVNAFMEALQHPYKEEIQFVRKIILKANPLLTEGIKWNAPSFSYQGEDRITFNLHGKDHFRLIFHCGVKVKEGQAKERLFEDSTKLLQWLSADRAMVQLSHREEVNANESALTDVVNKWIKFTS